MGDCWNGYYDCPPLVSLMRLEVSRCVQCGRRAYIPVKGGGKCLHCALGLARHALGLEEQELEEWTGARIFREPSEMSKRRRPPWVTRRRSAVVKRTLMQHDDDNELMQGMNDDEFWEQMRRLLLALVGTIERKHPKLVVKRVDRKRASIAARRTPSAEADG